MYTLLYAQNFKGHEKKITIEPASHTLQIGETLEYSIEWLGIPSGKVTMTVAGIEKVDGFDCYHIVCKAMPNKFFRMFYDTEYKLDSYIDTKELYSRRFEKVRRLNDLTLYETTTYDQEKHEARYTSYSPKGPVDTVTFLSKQKTKVGNTTTTKQILENTQDLLSTFYYFRLHPINEGQEYVINVEYGEPYPLTVKAGKPFWKDMRKKGTFPVFEIFLDSKLIPDILGKRKISVYMTADGRRVPLLFSLQTNIGAIQGMLQNPPAQ